PRVAHFAHNFASARAFQNATAPLNERGTGVELVSGGVWPSVNIGGSLIAAFLTISRWPLRLTTCSSQSGSPRPPLMATTRGEPNVNLLFVTRSAWRYEMRGWSSRVALGKNGNCYSGEFIRP